VDDVAAVGMAVKLQQLASPPPTLLLNSWRSQGGDNGMSKARQRRGEADVPTVVATDITAGARKSRSSGFFFYAAEPAERL